MRAILVSGVVLALAASAGAAPRAKVDEAALQALVARAGELDTDALIVIQDGKTLVDKWYDGEPRPIESMSVTKSVTAMAFGRLLTTGKLKSIDEPVSTWFPEWKQGRKRAITVRHLLEQTSGIQSDRMTGTEINEASDLVQLALCAELTSDPGTKFLYNNKATNLLPAILEKITGQRIDAYMKKEIFEPLGITDYVWRIDRAGHAQGMSGLLIRPADLAKLGQLMLDEGKWKGVQLLSATWVREATSPSARAPYYGQLWWLQTEHGVLIDDEIFEAWRRGGADPQFLAAIAPLKGRPLPKDDFLAAVASALKDVGGDRAWTKNTSGLGLRDGKIVDARVVGFRADGWQGQSLIVLPEPRLIVVRMREASQGKTEEEHQRFGFPELPQLVRKLIRTPVPPKR